MSAPASRPLRQPGRFWRLWWLPADGYSNALTDTGWAPIVDVDADLVPALLAELEDAGVPAHAAPTRPPFAVTPRRTRRQRPSPDTDQRWRLWVGTSRYSAAEELLRVRLPVLLRRRGTQSPPPVP